MRKSKISCLILLLLFICFVLAGCGSKQDSSVEITMIHGWGSTGEDHIIMREIYEGFEKEHPEIHVNLISMPSSEDVVNKVGDLLTVGKIPDIIFAGGEGKENIYRFMVEKNYAVDLMPYIEKDDELARSVSPFILDTWKTDNGNLYTVSDVLLMCGYWYNKEIFREAEIEGIPTTWEQWYQMCEKIEKLNKKRDTSVKVMVLDTNHVAYLTTVLIFHEGIDEVGDIKSRKLDVNSGTFKYVLSNLEKMSQYARVETDYNYLDTLYSFNAGETAVYINGVWASEMIKEDLPVAYAAFPSDDGSGVATRSACVGYILGNTGDEKRMAASVEFLKYMLSDTVAEKILKSTGQVPSNPNVKLTDENSSERMKQAVISVERAGILVETPENLWDSYKKENYEKEIILFLKGQISEEKLKEKMSKL